MQDAAYFAGRHLAPQPAYVESSALVEGETYFAVHFVDEEALVPELRAVVFIGRNREPDDTGLLYFQDAQSYYSGARYDAPGDRGSDIRVVDEGAPFVFDFDGALDMLLRCSLRRGSF